MQKLFIILLIVYCSLQIVKAQWVQQPIPTSQVVQDIHFLDSLHGWLACSNGAVNDSGLILYTSTGGASWITQRAVNSSPLYAIKMANLNTGYCTGRVILKTTNAGLNWVNINIFTDFVKDVSVPNTSGDTVFVVSELSGGGMWRSTNGGVNFTNIYPPADGRTLYFINNQTGWAEVGAFYLVRTTNGGTNWVTLQNFASDGIGDIFFVDSNTGWVLVSGVTGMLKTTNGGLNFVSQTLPAGSFGFGGMFFINSNTGWSGGIGNQFHKTTNSGNNWVLYTGLPIFTTRKINFLNLSTGWCATSGIAKSTNGGVMGITQINNEVPDGYKLYQNYPNPFNPKTIIKFEIKTAADVKLSVLDIIGRELLVITDRKLNAGIYETEFDGETLSSGVYFYRLIVNGIWTDTKKMAVVK